MLEEQQASMANSQKRYDICTTDYQLNPIGMFRFEVTSLYGRTFLNRQPSFKQTDRNLLNLGCGTNKIKDWINADFFAIRKPKRGELPDWMLDLRYPLNCDDNVWDGVFTEHTLEHIYPDRAMQLLKELHRTMKPGAWIRITVPDLKKYVNYYCGHESHPEFSAMFRTGSEAIRTLTQDFIHLSTWDSELLRLFLGEAGFTNIQEVAFMAGSDRSLLQDRQERAWETLYVEAQKSTKDSLGSERS
jgi:predicted SAM-dependent methyltransferase